LALYLQISSVILPLKFNNILNLYQNCYTSGCFSKSNFLIEGQIEVAIPPTRPTFTNQKIPDIPYNGTFLQDHILFFQIRTLLA